MHWGGVSPIEEFYYISEFLNNNPAPQYIIYSQSPIFFMSAHCFWSQSVYLHRISLPDMFDLYLTNKSIDNEVMDFNLGSWLDIALYMTYSPVYYSSASFDGLFSSNYKENLERYNEVSTNRGQIFYGREQNDEVRVNEIAEYKKFLVDPLIDLYFRKIIGLCADYGIQFVFQSAPVTASTYQTMDKSVIAQYDAYISELQASYPDAVFHAELYPYKDDQFGDSAHLNATGAAEFSNEMRNKYADIFERQ